MKEKTLPMHLHRPGGVGTKEERILDQGNGTSWTNRRVVLKQLMGKNKAEVHRQLSSPARRQARRPRAVA